MLNEAGYSAVIKSPSELGAYLKSLLEILPLISYKVNNGHPFLMALIKHGLAVTCEVEICGYKELIVMPGCSICSFYGWQRYLQQSHTEAKKNSQPLNWHLSGPGRGVFSLTKGNGCFPRVKICEGNSSTHLLESNTYITDFSISLCCLLKS